jgi:hypothetical protein
MAKFLYFNGLTELNPTSIQPQGRGFIGEPIGYVPTFDRVAKKWVHNYLPVNRKVELKSFPSRHECDSRCTNATGRTMQCECSCGGKNHGKGAFMCEAA